MFYGLSCLFTERMVMEFKRYGLGSLRVFTGVFQILLSALMLYGFYDDKFLILSSFLFSAMMLVAILARLRVKDSFKFIIPAIFYFLLNILILIQLR